MEPALSAPRPAQEGGPLPEGQRSPDSFTSAERPTRPTLEQQKKVETREVLPAPVGREGGDPAFTAIPIPALPPVQSPVVQQPLGTTVTDDNPIVAADDDLIEKEWVDKAKKIISTTKADPYLQEKEISKLQADYLSKRYGKEVKTSAD